MLRSAPLVVPVAVALIFARWLRRAASRQELLRQWAVLKTPTKHDTQQFIKLADTLIQAGSAMDDEMTLVQLQQHIQNTAGFAGRVTNQNSDRPIHVKVNRRMTETAIRALCLVAVNEGVPTPTVTLKEEVRQPSPGMAMTWQLLPESDQPQQVQWSANLMLVYLFAHHHGGQITINQHEMTVWLPCEPREIDMPGNVDNWLENII